MVPGVGGQLIASAYLEQQLLPALARGDAGTGIPSARALVAWWRTVSRALGPASSARAVWDVAVAPLLALLGHAVPPGLPQPCGVAGVLGEAAQPALVVVALPWAGRPAAAWRDAVRLGLAREAPWALVSNGQVLRVIDCLRPWSHRALEFTFAALVDDPRGAQVLGALAGAGALRTRPEHAAGPTLAAVVAESDRHAAAVCRSLGSGVLEALPGLAAALGPVRAPARAFEQALTIVYRLLFLLFAESRGLVPTWHEVYREAYTIDALCRRITARTTTPPGLWPALQAISRMAHAGCRAGDLDVPAFNGRLFSPSHTPLAERRTVPDAVVSQAVLALATTPSRAGRTRVGYQDLGVEQLGSIYERVLDYAPAVNGASLTLRRDPSGRKASGSFYTPRAITEFLVRRTLAPLVEGRSADEILGLRIVDPAMGSGAFLVAACRYLADHCERARVRDGDWRAAEVTDEARAALRREVAERCLYGVDLNPTAVQLARLSLWLTTLASDRPLTFLDHHLAVGDSLLGAALVDLGRPPVARAARRGAPATMRLPLFDAQVARILAEDVLPVRLRLALDRSDTAETVRDKERRLAALASPDGPFAAWTRAADVWCAIHLWPEAPPSAGLAGEMVARALEQPAALARRQLDPWLTRAGDIARQYAVFHWQLAFPEVFFDQRGQPRADGGFDAVLGNPPWDMLRADSGPAAGRPAARAQAAALLRYVRTSGVYRCQGSGQPNRYQLFLERAWQLARRGGRIGLILPSGIGTDLGSAPLRRQLLERCHVDTWLGFDNRRGIFPIHRSVRFVLLAATTAGSTDRLRYRSALHDPAALDRRPGAPAEDADEDAVELARARIEAWDPEYLTVPELPDRAALDVVAQAAEAAPALGAPDGWGVRFGRELNATDDRPHFVAWRPQEASSLSLPTMLPIVDGRHVSPFRVSLDAVERAIPRHRASRLVDPRSTFGRVRLAYRDVASATNRLTLMAALLPRGVLSTHTLFCLKTPCSLRDQWCLAALLNSLMANYLVRLRVTTHLTAALMARLPVPRPPAGSAAFRELVALAVRLSRAGIEGDPASYARLNALVAALYGLTPQQYARVVGSFPLLPRELRERCLSTFRRQRPDG